MSKPRLHILCNNRLIGIPARVEQKATKMAFRISKGPNIPNPYPDLLYAESGLLNIRNYSGPYVVFCGGNYWVEWRELKAKIDKIEDVLRRARLVICISKFLANMTRGKVGVDNVTHLPAGLWGTQHVGYKVNPKRFVAKTDWRIKGRPKVCMSISMGEEIKYKGVPWFMKVTKKLAVKHNVKFVCVGRLKQKGAIVQRWGRKYGLVFKAWRRHGDAYAYTDGLGDSEWPKILGGSDIFVHPSMWDGWPCTVADSMMSAVPALVFDVTGSSEVGQNVLKVDPGDRGAIVGGFERLLTDEALREKMGVAALMESQKKIAKHKGDFAKLLMDVLEGKK